MEPEKASRPLGAFLLLCWAAHECPPQLRQNLPGPEPGVRRLGVSCKLGQITLGLSFLIGTRGMKMPHDTRTGGCGRGGRSLDKDQAASVAGPKLVPQGSHEGGLEAGGRRETPQKPLHHAASSRQAPEAEDLRNLLVQAFPLLSRAFIRFESGPSRGTGQGLTFWGETPHTHTHTAFLSTEQIKLPVSSNSSH